MRSFKPVSSLRIDEKRSVSTVHRTLQGTISIHFTRSWTGIKHCIIEIKRSNDSSGGSNIKIEAIIWEPNRSGMRISEDFAKIEVVRICRSLLSCDFGALPKYECQSIKSSCCSKKQETDRSDTSGDQAKKEVVIMIRYIVDCELNSSLGYDISHL